jgi:hypothetical protein
MTTIRGRFARARVRAYTSARAGHQPAAEFRTETTQGDREEVIALPVCRRCGWPRGGPGCRAAHRLNLGIRMWSRREWLRYRRTGRLPAWDYTSRRDRRRDRRGAR